MFQKILVAIDMSDMSDKVFAQALSLAKSHQASLMLLHVLSAEEDYSPLPIPPDLATMYPASGNDLTLQTWQKQWEEFEKQGLELLQSLSLKAADEGVSAEYQQLYGSPARTICKLAQDWPADLIVVGHRGRSGLSEMILGSVSNYILHRASCSVLIVQ